MRNPVIDQASPTFYDIYDDALAAEDEHLEHATGPCYRKALEFLVKDYVSAGEREALHTAEETGDGETVAAAAEKLRRIQAAPLGSVIDQRISDARIRETAKRAAWLGNDATHYIRKWEDHDLQDLKDLIALVIGFIESEESYKKMLARMPDPGASS
jgi:hypothetical protein